jgi:hypothetical protein
LVDTALQDGRSSDQRKGQLEGLLGNFKSCYEELKVMEAVIDSILILSVPLQGGFFDSGQGSTS